MKTKFLLAMLSIVFLFSCKKAVEYVSPYSFNVNAFDTNDAKLLLIIKDGNSTESSTNRLVKIKADGSVAVVEFKDVNGNVVSDKFRPLCLSNANPDFMLMSFSREGDNPVDGYLVNKKTGALTSVSDFGGLPTFVDAGVHLNYPLSYYDGSSFLYYIANFDLINKTLVRVSTVNPGFITGQRIIADSFKNVTDFGIDADKNIMFNGRGAKGNTQFLISNSNNTTVVPYVYGSASYWVGLSGNFIFQDVISGYTKKTLYDAPTNTFSFVNDQNLRSNGINESMSIYNSYKISYGGKFILVSNGKIYELQNSTNTPKKITSLNIQNQKAVTHSQNLAVAFIAGENASGQQTIFRVDLANNYAFTTYPAPGKYNFYEIEAFEDGTVYATAKRNSDGVNVILKFAPDGTETLLDDKLNLKGIWLEKVTEFTNN